MDTPDDARKTQNRLLAGDKKRILKRQCNKSRRDSCQMVYSLIWWNAFRVSSDFHISHLRQLNNKGIQCCFEGRQCVERCMFLRHEERYVTTQSTKSSSRDITWRNAPKCVRLAVKRSDIRRTYRKEKSWWEFMRNIYTMKLIYSAFLFFFFSFVSEIKLIKVTQMIFSNDILYKFVIEVGAE